jgi:hypothetical protein
MGRHIKMELRDQREKQHLSENLIKIGSNCKLSSDTELLSSIPKRNFVNITIKCHMEDSVWWGK